MASGASVEKIVERVIRERLSSDVVNKVIVSRDTDADGDEVLRIAIILEGKPDELDRDRLVGLMRHIRSQLVKVSDGNVFPILSFVSKNEAKKINLEA